MNDKPGRLFFISNSAHPCTEIALDANRIRKFYQENGWKEAVNPSEADDLIVSTCAYNQHYEDAAIEDILDRRRQLKPGGRLITTGCLSKISPERFEQAGGEIAVPPLEMKKFDSLVKGPRSINDVSCNSVKLK